MLISRLSERLNNNRNLTNMTTYAMTKDDYDHIPTYDGNPEDLIYFTSAVLSVYNYVCADNNTLRDHNHARLLTKVKARLTGNARHCLLTNEFNSVDELIIYLQNSFKDSRTIEQLSAELFNTRPYFREDPLSYVDRIASIRALIFSRMKIEADEDTTSYMRRKDSEIIYYVRSNMHPDLCDFLAHIRLTNLDDVRNALHNEAAHIIERIYGQRRHRQDSHPRPPRPQGNNTWNRPRNWERDYPAFSNQPHLPNSPYQSRPTATHNQHYTNNHYQTMNPRPPFANQQNTFAPRQYNTPNYNRPWDKHKQDEFFRGNNTPHKHESQNTVSMRTVRSNPTHHIEDPTDADRITGLEAKVNSLVDKLDHFLELGPPQPAPNIP